jgi:hypothetical protein
MPTRQNRYFNNPQMAAAFSNLAGIFAPPSAQDFLAMAKTQGVDEQNARLSQLFQAAGGDFDLMGMAAGQWNPNQSFYAVDQGNAVTMRVQDVKAQNNLDVQRMRGEQSARETAFNAAVDHRGRQAISDADISAYLGLDIPGFDAAGPVAPTETQVRGRLLAESGLTPEEMAEIERSGVNIATVLDDDGGLVNVPRHQSVGRQVPNPQQAKAEAITFMRGGQRVGGFVRNGQYVDSEGVPLSPEEAGTVARIGQPQGSLDDVAPGPVDYRGYRATNALVFEANSLADDIVEILNSAPARVGLPGQVQSFVQDIGQVGREFAQMFGADLDSLVDVGAFEGWVNRTGQAYDPAFRQIRRMMLDMAYLSARLQDPNGQVSRYALQREVEMLGQDLVTNDLAVDAAVSAFQRRIQRVAAANEIRIGRDAPDIGSLDDFNRSRRGAPAPAQGAPTGAPQGAQAPAFQAGTLPKPDDVDPGVWNFLTEEEQRMWLGGRGR